MHLIGICTGVLGLFLAFPLIAMARIRPANFWLGMFVMSIALLSMVELYEYSPQLIGVFDWPVAGIGAFYYCYVRSIVGLGNTRWQALHFVPMVLWTLLLVWLRLNFPVDVILDNMNHGDVGVFGVLLVIFQIMAGIYALAVLYRLKQYRKRLRESYASTRNRDLTWLSWLTVVIIALLLVWMPATALGGVWDYCLFFGRLTTLYFVGWFGIRQAPVFLSPAPVGNRSSAAPASAIDDLPPAPNLEVPSEIAPVPAPVQSAVAEPAVAESATVEPTATEKYARSGMTDAAQQLIGERLTRRMSSERDYLETDIKLTDLADRIGTSPQLLSQYLNDVLDISFFDYINGMRVAAVQDMMRDPLLADRTLIELAFSAGFNSKSTFNASFKQFCGTTPSNWRNLHARTSEPIG